MTTAEIFAIFQGNVCPACDGPKNPKNAFCGKDYRRLPKGLQNRLWQKFGDGFEEAFEAAAKWHKENKEVKA